MAESDLPNTRVPVEFLVKLKPNRGYSKRALLANVAKNGETEEYILAKDNLAENLDEQFGPEFEIEDRRGNPRPIIPLV